MSEATQPRATILITASCNNHCVFCAREGLTSQSPDIVFIRSSLEQMHSRGITEVTFVGGEPLLTPLLPEAIQHARKLGFSAIGIQSNGRGSNNALVAALDAGLTDVHLSLHGATAAVHDFHTGVEGSFAQAHRTLASARAAGASVVVSTVLTRSNYRVLGDVPRLLHARGVGAWCITIPVLDGRASEAFERVHPRLGLAIPFALHALDTARRMNLLSWIAGAPDCLLGPFAALALPTSQRAFGAACDECNAKHACTGIDPLYLQRFGGDELIRRSHTTVRTPLNPTTARLQRMFVGPGETHHDTTRRVLATTVREARRSLKVVDSNQH